MNFNNLRRCAAVVREVPLETVLILRGVVRDRLDKAKWHSEQGPLSVSGPKFINWQRHTGGGRAIDLVMHLADVDLRTAVAWLQQHLAVGHVAVGETTTHSSTKEPSVPEGQTRTLRLPVPNDRMLGRVRQYLMDQRCLPVPLIEPLIESGKLYADSQGNAVFLLVAGKANRPVGAELRGTGTRIWRGMAPDTRKDLGYFWIGAKGSKKIVLCESAIDSMSYFKMHADRICISTSPRPAFEPTLHGWPQPLGLAAPGVIGSPVIPPRPTPRTEGGLYRLGLATTRPGDAIKRQVMHHPLHHPRRDLWVFLDEFGR